MFARRVTDRVLSAVVSREHVAGDAEQPGAGHGHCRQLIRLADDL